MNRIEYFKDIDGVRAYTFTRHGGVSHPPFDTLNLGLGVGDDDRAVFENRRIVAKDFFDGRAPVSCRQVHGDLIRVVDQGDRGMEMEGCDGLITVTPAVPLMILHADCLAVILYDSRSKVLANLHCGWRSSALGIIDKAVGLMADLFGSRPQEMMGVISPGIGPCCYQFRHWRELLPESFHSYVLKGERLDLWGATEGLLERAGIRRRNLRVSRRCSFCDPTFFSYRRRPETGRNGTVAMLL